MMKILIYLLMYLIVYRFIRYITTPVLKKIGFYQYYSPLFFIMPWFNGTRDIHMGTSWDFFKLKGKMNSKILHLLTEGLVNLIEDIERGGVKAGTQFRGNTHFLKESALKKYGFHYRNLNFFEYILFSFTYLEDCMLRSLAMKKISFIPLNNIKIVTFTGYDLLQKKDLFYDTLNKLTRPPARKLNQKVKKIEKREMVKVA